MLVQFVNERSAPDIEPSLDLQHWRIVVRGNGDLHLTAQMDSGAFRVTSKLHCLDVVQDTVRTESGRSYRLSAPPEQDLDLAMNMRLRAARDLQVITGDVSEVVWQVIVGCAWLAGTEVLLPPPH